MSNYITAEYINPIRFREQRNQTTMPQLDLMNNRVQYYNGIKPLEYYPDWRIDIEISIQLIVDTRAGTPGMKINTPTGNRNMVARNITPAGYESGFIVVEYTYTPDSEGEYYMFTETTSTLPSGQYQLISDVFYVRPNDQDLIQLVYSDPRNRYGGIFYDSTSQIWQGVAFFTGQYFQGEPANELTVYKDDLGSPTKLTAEPQDTVVIQITDITRNHLKQLNRMFSCEDIYLNGQKIVNVDNMSVDPIPKTDGINVEITATLKYE